MVVVHSPIQFVRLVFFLIHILSAAAEQPEDFCDRATYGVPKYSSCIALLYGSPVQHGAGIFNIDNDEHGFLLPYFGGSAQFTINQWRHRITLPRLWHNGTLRYHTQTFVGDSYLADMLYIEFCRIALLVRSNPAGGFTTDSGSWSEIARRGKALLDTCLSVRQITKLGGGVGHAGSLGRLDIVIYQEGSAFDRAISSGMRRDDAVVVETNGTMVSSSGSGRIGNLSHASAGIDLVSG